MANSVAGAIQAKIHYHTGLFTGKDIGAMAVIGGIGVTVLVIGILASLHVIGGIPPHTATVLKWAGGLILAGDFMALFIHAIQHGRMVKVMKERLNPEHIDTYWKPIFDEALMISEKTAKPKWGIELGIEEEDSTGLITSVLYASWEHRSIHLFPDPEHAHKFTKTLESAEECSIKVEF